MRDNDFSQKIKFEALKRAGFRCERCWRNKDLELHHRVPIAIGGKSDIDNCVVLCSECHRLAPNDPLLFKQLFMRFASTKEMIQYYSVETENEAMECWCNERNYDKKEIIQKLEENYPSHRDLVYKGMAKKASDGKLVGFNIPYGYNYENGVLVINKDEAEVVKSIFENYLEKGSVGAIAKTLQDKKIPTKRSGRWRKQTIASILKNPLYCGFIEWDGILNKGTHEPIIEATTFNKIQKEMVYRIRRPKQKYEPRLLPENNKKRNFWRF